MSISPVDFLDSAKQSLLSAEQYGEVAIRNAISRAYYAAFHQARSVFPVDREFGKNAGVGMHEAYIDQLMQADTGSDARWAAVKLKSLKGRRANADYRLDNDLPAYHATMQVTAAEELFKKLEELVCSVIEVSDKPTVPDGKECHAGLSDDDSPSPSGRRPKLQRIL